MSVDWLLMHAIINNLGTIHLSFSHKPQTSRPFSHACQNQAGNSRPAAAAARKQLVDIHATLIRVEGKTTNARRRSIHPSVVSPSSRRASFLHHQTVTGEKRQELVSWLCVFVCVCHTNFTATACQMLHRSRIGSISWCRSLAFWSGILDGGIAVA